MTWHTSTTTRARLERMLDEIRQQCGTVTSCQRFAAGLVITWFTA